MKRIINYILCLTGILLLNACEQTFERDNEPLIVFNTTEYPQVKGFLVENQSLTNQTLLLAYRNGGNRTVSINLPNQFGVYAEDQTVTLAEDEGDIEIPLKGVAPEAGLMALKVRISYDIYHLFCEATIGVRPEIMGDIEISTAPQLNGFLYQNLDASGCFISLNYQNGWGRTISARFTCGDAGISTETQTFKLAADDEAKLLAIRLKGIPETAGKVNLHLFLLKEGETEETEYTFSNIEILQPIPYEPATVSHTIIITDRNTLMTNGGIAETASFSYNTVFVDINKDGFVSGNYEIWLDKNVGATSTDVTSTASYGFIYQPGRNAPGWVSNSQTGTTYPGEKYTLNNAAWFNGTTSPVVVSTTIGSSITVEAGKTGPNNPCPHGYRLPSSDEWKKLQDFLSKEAGSFKDGILALPFSGGYLKNLNTECTGIGTNGYYWGNPYDNNQVSGIFFTNALNGTTIVNRLKGMGLSVRCIKANENEMANYE